MTDRTQLRRGRRTRMSDAETGRRMLDAGVAAVAREGLSLSLEHVNMEDLIAAAGVSRTSSYRKWPTKGTFAADLLLHMAKHTELTPDPQPYSGALHSAVATLSPDLSTPAGRHDVAVEVFRHLVDADFAASLDSPSWRTFVALRAAHGSLPQGALRDQIGGALHDTERAFTRYRAAALAHAASLFGYRLRDADAIDWTVLAELVNASFTGCLVRASSDRASVMDRRHCAPFGSSTPADWSLVGLACGGAFFGAIEPDPDSDWDAARVAEAQALLGDADSLLAAILPTAAPPSD